MHPSDGALRALLDGAAGLEDEAHLAAHLGRCERCRGLAATLKEQRMLVSALLEELDAPVPSRSVAAIVRRAQRRQRRRWQLIAVAASLLVVAVGNATVRTHLLQDVVRWFLPSSPAVSTPAPQVPSTVATPEAPTVIALEPTDDLQIEFAAVQPEGELLITLGAANRVTMTATDPVPYTLSRYAITVDNAGARASYNVALPERSERAAIRVAGRLVFSKQRSAIVTDATRESADTFRLAFANLGVAP